MSVTVTDNDFIEPWQDNYRVGDQSTLEEYADDVLSFGDTGSPFDITDPGPLYENLLFQPEAWERLLTMRQALAGRARIRFILTGAADAVDWAWEAAPMPRVSGGVVSLGRDPDVSLVRVTGGATRGAVGMTSTRVLVATATDLSGRHLLSGGEWVTLRETSGRPPRDAGLIQKTLGKIGFDVETPAEVTRRSLGAGLSARHYAFVFCGHHVTRPRPGLLVHADSDDDAATADLLDHAWLATLLGGAPPALAVLVACDSGEPGRTYGSLARLLADSGVPLVVGVYGTLSHHDAEEFAATFFEELAQGAPADAAVAKARAHFRDRHVLPVLYAHSLPELRRAAPAPILPEPVTFQAWALPAGWSPRTPLPISDTRQVRLDLLWTLDRGPLTAVLADSQARTLADSLNAAEAILQSEAARQRRLLTRRAWHEYDAGTGIPETLDGWLGLDGHPAAVMALLEEHMDGANLGLVVKAHAPRPPWQHGGEWARRIARFAAFRDSELPAAALVIQVIAEKPIDAVLAANDVAERLQFHGPDLLCRILPWTTTQPVPLRGAGANAFTAAIAAARDRRGLHTGPLPDVAGNATSATVAAEQMVAEAPQEFDAEVAILLDTRDWLPGCYEPLLTAYARHRDGPGRYAAMVAASSVDAHIDFWLEEAIAGGRPPLPEEAPPVAMRVELVDALLWALRRRGRSALLDAWLKLRQGEPVHRLIDSTRADVARQNWADEDPALVRRLARETRLTWVNLADASPDRLGWWAALSQLPLKRELAKQMLALKNPFPLVTGLVGSDDRTPADVTDTDLVAQLRRAYHPTRHERV